MTGPGLEGVPSASDWWNDNGVWYRVRSADGSQIFDGQRWKPTHPRWRILRFVSLAMLALTPVVVLVGFGYIAGEPSYPGEPPPRLATEVALGYVFWGPVWGTALFIANRRLGRPGYRASGRRSASSLTWEPPPGWPPAPPGWQPQPGWRPDPEWPPPPPGWRGWTRVNWAGRE